MFEILIEPPARGFPSCVAQSTEQAPLRVKLRRRTELRHETVIADPVHEHATVFGFVQFAIPPFLNRKSKIWKI